MRSYNFNGVCLLTCAALIKLGSNLAGYDVVNVRNEVIKPLEGAGLKASGVVVEEHKILSAAVS